MVIRAFSQQRFEEKRFDKAKTGSDKYSLFVNHCNGMYVSRYNAFNEWSYDSYCLDRCASDADSSMQVGDMMALYSMLCI